LRGLSGWKKLADIPVEDISEYVVKPDTFVWVALRDAQPEELTQMQEEFGLHELAVEDASAATSAPRSRSMAIRCSWW
jgi:magnesium transporter